MDLERSGMAKGVPGPDQVRDIEARVRGISGSIDELGEALQHHADQLRSQSPRILTEIADKMTARQAPGAVGSDPEIARRIHHAVASEVARIVSLAQEVIRYAMERTGVIGHELGRADCPGQGEITSLIRDVPQFDMPSPLPEVVVGTGKAPAKGLLRSRLRRALMKQYKEPLQQALEEYSRNLQQWSQSLIRAVQESVGSYVDGKR